MAADLELLSEQVHSHFRRYEVEYLQFAFRWMNNLLMRELPLRCTIRLWDTYQVSTQPVAPALPCLLHWIPCRISFPIQQSLKKNLALVFLSSGSM